MADVLQCPHCELRFRSDSELRQHVSFDHPDKITNDGDEVNEDRP